MATIRKTPLVDGQYYHIYTRSIAKFKVFNNESDYQRIIDLLSYCRFDETPCKFSKFLLLCPNHQKTILKNLGMQGRQLVSIVAYCIMPTHIHLILKQNQKDGISKFMNKILDSYSKYFNLAHHRRGPLWEDRFQNILVETDEQILHLTRYIHLNPASAGLVKKPNDWAFSSFAEYLGESGFCEFKNIIDVNPKNYQKFVDDQVAIQKELSKIKKLLIGNYSD